MSKALIAALASTALATTAAVAVSANTTTGDTPTAAAAGTQNLTFVPVTPFRAYDSREDNVGKIVGGTGWTIDVAHDAAKTRKVPANAAAVTFNLTYTEAEGAGFLSINPGDYNGPNNTSHVNFAPGATGSNAGTVSVPVGGDTPQHVLVGAGGGGKTHFIIDITGYYVP